MRKIFSILFVILSILLLWGPLYAGQTNVTTYYSAPYGNYKELVVNNSLTAGDAVTTASVSMFGNNSILNPLLDVLDVNNNLIGGWAAGTSGGNLMISGNVDIQDGNGNSLFYVNAATNMVGMGTSAPRAPLEVVGDVAGMITAAHQDPNNWQTPWLEFNSQYGDTVDPQDSTSNNYGPGDRISAVYDMWGSYYFGTLHLDGNPLVFQTQQKPGLSPMVAQGLGQVAIRSYIYPIDNNLILVVGEPVPSIYNFATMPPGAGYSGNQPVALANAWNPLVCSRKYKKDIVPFSLMDYRETLSKLSKAAIVNYHYKMEKPNSKLHTGFIAEDAPLEITSSKRKAVSLQNEAGFLLASLKALKIEDQEFKQRVERLKQWLKSGN